ncbi:MAG: hypothetical protein KF704_08375 [Crocinitomicaceae bacterium]|nr:hypothetical protein [Crocinitomicaceae bacterium]
MKINLKNTILNYFESQKQLSREDLLLRLTNDFPQLSKGSISVYLSRLKKNGFIKNPYRGIYALSDTKEFNPQIELQLKKIYNKIYNRFPFITFCIWNTRWLNDLMKCEPFKYLIIIEVEKESSEQVFQLLNEELKNVYLNPNEETLDRYIYSNNNESVIVKNLITEAPILEKDKIIIPTLEKILIDLIADKDIFLAQQSELNTIYQIARSEYTLSISKVNRYAMRRNKEAELRNNIIGIK